MCILVNIFNISSGFLLPSHGWSHVADGVGLSEKDATASVLSKQSWILRPNARTVTTFEYSAFKFRVLLHFSKREFSTYARCEKGIGF
jgi:hypothetical protein